MLNSEVGILTPMNSERTDPQVPAPSLRDVPAFQGIESSYDRDRRKTSERLGRMFAAQPESEAVIPGIEVAYLELDLQLWDQMAFAS